MCDQLGLSLNRKKTRVVPIADYYKWLKTKFIVSPTGKVVLKMNRQSTVIVKRKYRSFKAKVDDGSMTLSDVRCCHNSYRGHMERGNSFKVLQNTEHYFKSIFGFYPDIAPDGRKIQHDHERRRSHTVVRRPCSIPAAHLAVMGSWPRMVYKYHIAILVHRKGIVPRSLFSGHIA